MISCELAGSRRLELKGLFCLAGADSFKRKIAAHQVMGSVDLRGCNGPSSEPNFRADEKI